MVRSRVVAATINSVRTRHEFFSLLPSPPRPSSPRSSIDIFYRLICQLTLLCSSFCEPTIQSQQARCPRTLDLCFPSFRRKFESHQPDQTWSTPLALSHFCLRQLEVDTHLLSSRPTHLFLFPSPLTKTNDKMDPAEQSTATSRDWTVLPEDETVDQATDLPEVFTLDTNVIPPLKNRADFGAWLRNITLLLRERGLDKLIDFRIARPFRQGAGAKRWLEFSRKIQHCLAQNMADHLIREITAGAHGARIQLADEFIEQAKKIFQTPGVYADMEGVASFMSMNISSFASARDFAWGLKEQFNNLWEQKGVRIPPYYALCMLLNRLDTMEHRYIVAATISELNARATQGELWSTFTNVDFHVCVFNIIQRLEKTGKAAIVPTMTRPATSEASKRTSSFHYSTPPPGVKYFPPPGANEDEYAAGLRASLPQITMDMNCAYCGQKYHVASKCYYLNPDTRPYYWRPLEDIWTYKKGQHGGFKSYENTPFQGSSSSLDNRVASLPAKMGSRLPAAWWDTTPSGTPSRTTAKVDAHVDPQPADQPDSWTDTRTYSPIPTGSETDERYRADTRTYSPISNGSETDARYRADTRAKASSEAPKDAQPDAPTDLETAVEPTDQFKEDDNQKEDAGSATETPTKDQFEDVRDYISFEDTPFDPALKFNKGKSDWLIFNSGYSAHICADRSAFTELHEYGPDEPRFSWIWVGEGTRQRKGTATAKGKGKVAINVDFKNETKTLTFDAYYYPESRFSIFFGGNAGADHKLEYEDDIGCFLDMEHGMKRIGGTVEDGGFYFLRLSGYETE